MGHTAILFFTKIQIVVLLHAGSSQKVRGALFLFLPVATRYLRSPFITKPKGSLKRYRVGNVGNTDYFLFNLGRPFNETFSTVPRKPVNMGALAICEREIPG